MAFASREQLAEPRSPPATHSPSSARGDGCPPSPGAQGHSVPTLHTAHQRALRLPEVIPKEGRIFAECLKDKQTRVPLPVWISGQQAQAGAGSSGGRLAALAAEPRGDHGQRLACPVLPTAPPRLQAAPRLGRAALSFPPVKPSSWPLFGKWMGAEASPSHPFCWDSFCGHPS